MGGSIVMMRFLHTVRGRIIAIMMGTAVAVTIFSIIVGFLAHQSGNITIQILAFAVAFVIIIGSSFIYGYLRYLCRPLVDLQQDISRLAQRNFSRFSHKQTQRTDIAELVTDLYDASGNVRDTLLSVHEVTVGLIEAAQALRSASTTTAAAAESNSLSVSMMAEASTSQKNWLFVHLITCKMYFVLSQRSRPRPNQCVNYPIICSNEHN